MQVSKDRTTVLYDGNIEIKFIDSNHSYWIRNKTDDGGWTGWRRAPGSTTIIGIMDKSMALVPWAVKIYWRHLKAILSERVINIYDIDEGKDLHRNRKDIAATSGSLVHDWIENYTKGLNPPDPDQPAVLNGVNAFRQWLSENDITIIGSETLIYSKEHHFCGQADFIFYKGDDINNIYLGDYKTSNGLYAGVFLQTASYLRAIEEMGLQYVEWTNKEWLEKVDLTQVKFVGRFALRLEKRSEEDFQRDMEEKGMMDVPYQIFEYIDLDAPFNGTPGDFIEIDFQGFLKANDLRNWNLQAEPRIKAYRGVV